MSRLQMKNSSALAIKRTDDNRRENYREKRARVLLLLPMTLI